MTTTKVKVGRRALIQRINRALKAEGEVLKATRGGAARSSLGDFYTVNTRTNGVGDRNIDLEKYGRSMKVLAAWEELDEGEAR